MSQVYNERVFENEEALFASINAHFPSNLQSYLQQFQTLNHGDICTMGIEDLLSIHEGYVFYYQDRNMTEYYIALILGRPTLIITAEQLQQQCAAIQDGVLQAGLRTAVFMQALNAAQFRDSMNHIELTLTEVLASTTFNSLLKMMEFIMPCMLYLN
jgi:hypothetical protein